MDFRPLGNTGLTVSALSFGASSLGGVFRDIDETEAIKAVHVALDGGMNLIDVSPFYGLTKAETVLGKALKNIDRDRYILATKCGRYGDNLDDFDFSEKRTFASIDESLSRLGVDHVDILQAHDIEYSNLDQVVNETIPALEKIKASGKARFIGITGLPLKIFTHVVSRVPNGTLDTILSYCHHELNDTSLLDILPQMQEAGIGVINASPIGMGLLSHRGTPDWHPATDRIKEVCAKAAAHCQQQGANIVQLAMQFAVSNPRVPTTLVGSANPTNIEKNLQWVEQPINQTLLDEVLDILKPIHNHTWPVGRPENN